MPNRILREGILTSPRMAKLGWAEEVLYRRLMSVVDDFGRYFADPGLVRAACFPRQLNKVSDSDIGKWLQVIAAAGLVRVYPAQDGESYLELIDFRQQVRAAKSKFPEPPSTCVADAQQVQSNPPASAPVFVSVSVSECVVPASKPAAPTRKPKASKTQIADDFRASDRVRAWAVEKGFDRVDEHLEAFVRKCKAKAYAYADWDLAFMEAIREDWAKLRGRAANGAAPAGEASTAPTKEVGKTAAYIAQQSAHAAQAVPPPPTIADLRLKLLSKAIAA